MKYLIHRLGKNSWCVCIIIKGAHYPQQQFDTYNDAIKSFANAKPSVFTSVFMRVQ